MRIAQFAVALSSATLQQMPTWAMSVAVAMQD